MVGQDQSKISHDVATGLCIICLLFGIAIYLPIIGFFASLLIPLPVIYYRIKLGGNKGNIIPLGAAVIMAMVIGSVSVDLFYFVELMLLGVILSKLLKDNISLEKTVGYACGTILGISCLCLFFYSNLTNIGITALVTDYITKNLELTLVLYRSLKVPEELINEVANALDQIKFVLVRITPALIIAATLLVVWINLILIKPILLRKNLYFPDFGKLNLWHAPESLIWGLIGSGLAIIFPFPVIKIIGINGLIVFCTIYFFQGMAIVSFFLEKKNMPLPVKFIIYSIITIQQFFLFIIVGIGLFDMWFNFRKQKT